MTKARFGHSSCLLGNALYVNGGQSFDGSQLAIERLANINNGIGEASHCWESLQISTKGLPRCSMTPLNCSEKILILGSQEDNLASSEMRAIKIDPKKTTRVAVKSEFDLEEAHDPEFAFEQCGVSDEGKKFVAVVNYWE